MTTEPAVGQLRILPQPQLRPIKSASQNIVKYERTFIFLYVFMEILQ